MISIHSTSDSCAPSSRPHTTIASALRIGTFNVRRSLTVTQHKLNTIIDRCTSLQLDIIALQEIGDPVIDASSHPHHHIIIAPGPSNHEAGVALLIRNHLKPRCRSYMRSISGRIVGVVIDINDRHRLLIISAYMPTGIDGQSDGSPVVQHAHELYREISQWTIGMHQVIVMGDLNETLTPLDRLSRSLSPSPHASATSPMHALINDNFIDEYRRHHPDASRDPGHTHINKSSKSTSRLDYIWTRDIDVASSTMIHIDCHLELNGISDHHLLWMELLLHQSSIDATPLASVSLPNLRAATLKHEQSFTRHLERGLHRDHDRLQHLAQADDASSLSDAASSITAMTRHSAFASFPITGAASRQSHRVQQLQRQRVDVTRLLHTSLELIAHHHHHHHHHRHPVCALTRSPEWVRIYRRCVLQHDIHWRIDIFYIHDHAGWLIETREHVRRIRQLINHERRCMNVVARARPSFDNNTASAVHRMLDSNALPSHLLSVVDSDGHLTTSAHEMKDVMVRHFTSVFAIPPPSLIPLAYDPPEMLFDKLGMQPEWYDGLMADVTPIELIRTISDAPRVSAPGEDEVSIGVWRIAIQNSALMCELVTTLFTSCLRNSIFPSTWKSSIIIPFVKDAKKERSMSNIRPISLQSCLGKLFNKILAHRLADIIARHPILNTAQRGFITGGTTIKCIDELLDAWDWSRTHQNKEKREQYTILYDIAQAYDSVQSRVLMRSLTRIGLHQHSLISSTTVSVD